MGKAKGKNKRNKKPESSSVKNVPVTKSRKDIRKEKRNLKKIHRSEYFSKSSKNTNKDEDVGKFVRFPQTDNTEKSVASVVENVVVKESRGAKLKEEKLKSQMKDRRNDQLVKANQEEDKIIKKLEKQLKLKKGKSGSTAKNFASDGLSYLLEVCEEGTMAAAVAAEKHLAETGSGSDFEEDLAIATGKTVVRKKTTEKKIDSSDEMETGSEEDDDDSSINDSEYDEEPSLRKKCEKRKQNTKDINDGIVKKKTMGKNNQPERCEEMETESEDGSDDDDDSSSNDSEYDEEPPVSKTCVRKKQNKKDVDDDDDFSIDDSDHDGESPLSKKSKKKRKLEEETEDEFEDEDSDLELDDSQEMDEDEEEMSDEDLESIYTGLSGFPDDTFVPGRLPSVKEETEKELHLDKQNLQPQQAKVVKLKREIHLSESLMDEEEDLSDDEIECDDSSVFDSDESECSNPECGESSCNESNDENAHIVVNGKKINTYGRDYAVEKEPDIVRCPILDSYLASISDSDNEVVEKDAVNNFVIASEQKTDKKSKKRKTPEDDSETKKKKKTKLEKSISKLSRSKKSTESPSDVEDEEMEEGSDEEKTWEDIYGRKRDQDGNVIANSSGKYVPPHLRNKSSDEESQEMIQIKRQIKGLLNKVSSSNMHWTSAQMESIYSSHSSNTVNSAFCSLWLSAIVQATLTADRMAAEHAMLVALLHANVGSQVGAHFLQTAVQKFNEMLTSDEKSESKQLNNLILGIAHLYNFKIFQASLLYEILNKLMEHISEKSVECTLVALRSVGAVLRKDDPAALKLFISSTQEKAANFKQSTNDGSRVKFLLDVLLAIKNNNMNKIPNYDPSYSEELKKAMKGILRKGIYIVTLNIGLEDLLKADERGRWWVVGSAWEGSSSSLGPPQPGNSLRETPKDTQQAQLLQLARHQRINTELRRNIFCIIMAAEDYMDAFEKLQQLGLKSQQEREIVHVLLSCALQEKDHNPYYSVLAQKLCDYDRKFQMSIQYAVWDKLKELDSCSTFQIINLAQFLTHLFIEKGLPISVLKVIQFSDLSKPCLRLMRQVLLSLLLHQSGRVSQEVFQRVAGSPSLQLFRAGLRLFISHFLVNSAAHRKAQQGAALTEEQMELLRERAAIVEGILQGESKVRF